MIARFDYALAASVHTDWRIVSLSPDLLAQPELPLKELKAWVKGVFGDWQYLSLGHIEKNEFFFPKVNLQVLLCLDV